MNYRQMITVIESDIHQAERNLNGLHERGDSEAVDKLTNSLRIVKTLAEMTADDSYKAIKKHLREERE